MKSAKSNAIPITFLILCCLAFLSLSYLACNRLNEMAVATGEKNLKTIVIDAGHGGEDGGATGKSKLPEKDINLAISKDLQQLLTASGYRVVMTRSTDTAVSDQLKTIRGRKVSDIHNRMKIIEAQGNCIFVSVHQNLFEQEQYHGAQVFYSKNNEGGKPLAESIQKRIASMLQKDNERMVKPATSSIYLLWHAKVPAVLVECGFLSNAEEVQKLNTQKYQQQMAFAIYSGLADFCSETDNGQ